MRRIVGAPFQSVCGGREASRKRLANEALFDPRREFDLPDGEWQDEADMSAASLLVMTHRLDECVAVEVASAGPFSDSADERTDSRRVRP